MKKIFALLMVASLACGCLETQKKPDTSAADAKKEADKAAAAKVASTIPPVTPESLNDMNAAQRAQALEAEIKRDSQNPPKVVVEAKK
ncbi:MAG: hypothetical protein ACJ8F7_04245 [Gemmataceae bacterium]